MRRCRAGSLLIPTCEAIRPVYNCLFSLWGGGQRKQGDCIIRVGSLNNCVCALQSPTSKKYFLNSKFPSCGLRIREVWGQFCICFKGLFHIVFIKACKTIKKKNINLLYQVYQMSSIHWKRWTRALPRADLTCHAHPDHPLRGNPPEVTLYFHREISANWTQRLARLPPGW